MNISKYYFVVRVSFPSIDPVEKPSSVYHVPADNPEHADEKIKEYLLANKKEELSAKALDIILVQPENFDAICAIVVEPTPHPAENIREIIKIR